jgi:hypothetical protein
MTPKQKESYIEQLRVLTNDRLTNAQLEGIFKWATTLPIEVKRVTELMDDFDSIFVYRVDGNHKTQFIDSYKSKEVDDYISGKTILKIRRDIRTSGIRLVIRGN